mmetsp:Transcript_44880/g.54353  ORF Transcript_44880/g.54353 Transcript_44880/m.54353 type:complete len:857 (-) Transcript_44880:361-2931(-)
MSSLQRYLNKVSAVNKKYDKPNYTPSPQSHRVVIGEKTSESKQQNRQTSPSSFLTITGEPNNSRDDSKAASHAAEKNKAKPRLLESSHSEREPVVVQGKEKRELPQSRIEDTSLNRDGSIKPNQSASFSANVPEHEDNDSAIQPSPRSNSLRKIEEHISKLEEMRTSYMNPTVTTTQTCEDDESKQADTTDTEKDSLLKSELQRTKDDLKETREILSETETHCKQLQRKLTESQEALEEANTKITTFQKDMKEMKDDAERNRWDYQMELEARDFIIKAKTQELKVAKEEMSSAQRSHASATKKREEEHNALLSSLRDQHDDAIKSFDERLNALLAKISDMELSHKQELNDRDEKIKAVTTTVSQKTEKDYVQQQASFDKALSKKDSELRRVKDDLVVAEFDLQLRQAEIKELRLRLEDAPRSISGTPRTDTSVTKSVSSLQRARAQGGNRSVTPLFTPPPAVVIEGNEEEVNTSISKLSIVKDTASIAISEVNIPKKLDWADSDSDESSIAVSLSSRTPYRPPLPNQNPYKPQVVSGNPYKPQVVSGVINTYSQNDDISEDEDEDEYEDCSTAASSARRSRNRPTGIQQPRSFNRGAQVSSNRSIGSISTKGTATVEQQITHQRGRYSSNVSITSAASSLQQAVASSKVATRLPPQSNSIKHSNVKHSSNSSVTSAASSLQRAAASSKIALQRASSNSTNSTQKAKNNWYSSNASVTSASSSLQARQRTAKAPATTPHKSRYYANDSSNASVTSAASSLQARVASTPYKSRYVSSGASVTSTTSSLHRASAQPRNGGGGGASVTSYQSRKSTNGRGRGGRSGRGRGRGRGGGGYNHTVGGGNKPVSSLQRAVHQRS